MPQSNPIWIPYALGSAFFAGLTAILAKVGVKEVDSNLATAIRVVVILCIAWSIVAWQGTASQLRVLDARTIWSLILSGVATGASWLCYFRALKLGPVSRVAPVDKLSVVFVVVLSAVFLHEKVDLRSFLGIVLMVGGALLLIK